MPALLRAILKNPIIPHRPVDHPAGIVAMVGAFTAQLTIFGTMYAFSTFINAIEDDAELGHPGHSTVALASGINFGLGPILGTVSGIVADKVGPRPLLFAAGLIQMASMYLTSIATTPTTFVLAFGPLMGIAYGLMVAPSAYVITSYFDGYRNIAMGVAYAGGGAGNLIAPLVASHLVSYYNNSFREPMRWLSLFGALCCLASACLARRRPDVGTSAATSAATPLTMNDTVEEHTKPAYDAITTVGAAPGMGRNGTEEEGTVSVTPIVAEAAGSDAPPPITTDGIPLRQLLLSRRFITIFLTTFFFSYGFASTVFYWVPYARSQMHPVAGMANATMAGGNATHKMMTHITTTTPTPTSDDDSPTHVIALTQATQITAAFGGAQVVGNLVLGLVASRFNPLFVYPWVCLLAAAGQLAWCWTRTLGPMIAIAAIVGLGCGAARGIIPALVPNHFPGRRVGTMMGFVFLGYGVGGFVGPYVTSALIAGVSNHYGSSQHGYIAGLSSIGVSTVLATLVFAFAVPKPLIKPKTTKDILHGKTIAINATIIRGEGDKGEEGTHKDDDGIKKENEKTNAVPTTTTRNTREKGSSGLRSHSTSVRRRKSGENLEDPLLAEAEDYSHLLGHHSSLTQSSSSRNINHNSDSE